MGEAVRIDVEVTEEGVDSASYILTDETTFYILMCEAFPEPPEDRWLSIAETFEFLPTEED